MKQLDLQGISDEVPFHTRLGLKVRRTGESVAFDADIGADYVVDRDSGAIHGGIVASLLDTAATFALIAQTDHDWITVDLRIDYLRPSRSGPLTITGDVLRAGRSIGRARAELTDQTGAVCATAIGTFAPVQGDRA
jgi:uncharacterized protein (TIGR00369 family)